MLDSNEFRGKSTNEPKGHIMTRVISLTRTLAPVLLVLAMSGSSPSGNGRKFYDDDPLHREPETQDASGVQEWEIDLFYDLAENLFGRPGDPTADVRARNINTIDEVPDSSWFTNRILARPVTIEEAARGPLGGSGPASGTWSVVRPKQAGFAPGFTMQDGKGETWFVSFDAKGFPEAATGAILVANKIFWTLGYWQVENYLVSLSPDQLVVSPSATVTPPSGKVRAMRPGDIEAVLRRSHRSADGTYRAVAARAVPGRPLGGFRYYGTRPDDPNDIIPHEHRRELRALKVFGAWTNLVDMKAGNTLDALVTADGRSVVRHYLQDVGSTFGTGANAPREYDEGWEYLFEGDLALKRLYTFGFLVPSWQTVRYANNTAVGRFEAIQFDPVGWRPRVPTAAFLRARADDTFWAARRVMAFSDDMIRAMVTTGRYTDPQDAKLLADVLIDRRDRIGYAYLVEINPVVNVTLGSDGMLAFDNAAVRAGVATPPVGGYVVEWARFDNTTGTTSPLGTSTATAAGRTQAPGPLPSESGEYIRLEIRAVQPPNPSWGVPVTVFFRRADGWRLIGLERMP
jgi:hypothetical protein